MPQKDIKSFLKIGRKAREKRPISERIKDFREVYIPKSEEHTKDQSLRCMDCGTPFCHWGCPLGNYIPEWNDLIAHGQLKRAYELLEQTSSYPEITGRVCPALCESACVLGINHEPVTVRENELFLMEEAFAKNWIVPKPPKKRTEKKVAVIGSGPAGLACAALLNHFGHDVIVFEKNEKIGGILRYGIPDFKMEKSVIDRRLNIWEKEGVVFKTNVEVGQDYLVEDLKKDFDAICLSGGAEIARDIKIPGRELKGIYFAMNFLTQANKHISDEKIDEEIIDAKDKKVVIIGGGDTGADCLGIAHRQGAASVTQIDVLPKPDVMRTDEYPWPLYPLILKNSTSHEEGGERYWSVLTKKFIGENGNIKKLSCVKVDHSFKEIPGTQFEIDADIVILAIGFLGPKQEGLLKDLGVALDQRGNVKTDNHYMTNVKGVFSAGDMRRGQSLVVWAMQEGRNAAKCMDQYLKSN